VKGRYDFEEKKKQAMKKWVWSDLLKPSWKGEQEGDQKVIAFH